MSIIKKNIREVIFGLGDGLVSTLGAISGIAIGSQDIFIVILAGFSIIFVESTSMAVGTYLSNKAKTQLDQSSIEQEIRHQKEQPEKEKQELKEQYKKQGFSDKEADMMVDRVTSDRRLWIEENAKHILNIPYPVKDNPKWDALIMGVSYIIGGFVPIIPYFVISWDINIALGFSVFVAMTSLFIVGAVKSKIVSRSIIKGGLEMFVLSLIAFAVGFAVGKVLPAIYNAV